MYLSQHLLWYYWLVGCTNCDYPPIQTKHWAFKNQCRMHTVAFLNTAWFLFLLTTKALTEHQHRADTQWAQGVSPVCAAQYCTADSQEQGADLFVQHPVSKLNSLSSKAPDVLTRSCVTMCQLRDWVLKERVRKQDRLANVKILACSHFNKMRMTN